jgi:protein-disulfide isomerase
MFLKSLAGALLALSLAAPLAACGEQGRAQIVNVEGDAFMGPQDAKVTVIEYGSPTCPGCKFWHDTFLAEMKRDYVDTNKIKFIFREFAVHGAIDAGIFSVARCAGKDDYFAVLDEAFARQRDIVMASQKGDSINALKSLGEKFKLSGAQVDACLTDKANVQRVNDVGAYARQIGVSSTPTFFINGAEVSAPDLSQQWTAMKAAIDAALAGQPAPTPITPPAGAVAPHDHVEGEQH